MTADSLKETQGTLLDHLRDDLVKHGWTLQRDNRAGGALVLSGDGMRVVASLHVYEDKDLPPVPVDDTETAPAADESPVESEAEDEAQATNEVAAV